MATIQLLENQNNRDASQALPDTSYEHTDLAVVQVENEVSRNNGDSSFHESENGTNAPNETVRKQSTSPQSLYRPLRFRLLATAADVLLLIITLLFLGQFISVS
jgi:hypothetical protein